MGSGRGDGNSVHGISDNVDIPIHCMTESNQSLHSDLPSARRVVVNFCHPWNGPADAAYAWASSSARPCGSRQPRYGCLADAKPTGQIGLRCATVGECRQGLCHVRAFYLSNTTAHSRWDLLRRLDASVREPHPDVGRPRSFPRGD